MGDDFISGLGVAFTAHRLRRLSEGLVEDCGVWFAAQGITAPPRAASTLRLLLQAGPQPVTQIASRLRFSHPFIVRLISDLEKQTLVEIRRDAADARKRIVHLTPSGLDEAHAFVSATGALEAAYRSLEHDCGVDLIATLDALEAALDVRALRDRLAIAPSLPTPEG